MKKRIMSFLLCAVMILTMVLQPMTVQAAETTTNGSKVITPSGYDENHRYPVIYVMPEDGKAEHNSGMTEKLQAAMENGTCTSMIIVETVFKTNDLHAEMAEIVNDIDANYNTIADAEHRAVIGTEVGGYLAYILGLTEVAEVVEEPEQQGEGTPAEEEKEQPGEETPAEEEAGQSEDKTSAEEGKGQPEDKTFAEEEAGQPEDKTPAEEGKDVPEGESKTKENVLAVTAEEVNPVETAAIEAEESEETTEPAKYTTLSAPKFFKYVMSTNGDFVSDANPWYTTYGSVYNYIQEMGSKILGKFYTYMDAAVNDTYTDMEGSTNDIGKMLIGFGLTPEVSEFTVRSGAVADVFAESITRMVNRLTESILGNVASGSVSLTKPALTADVENAEATYTVNANYESLSSTEEEMTVIISVIDPNTSEVLTSVEEVKTVATGETITGTMELENLVNGSSSTVQLSVKVLGAEVVLATATLARIQDTVVDGDYQYIDLMGDWYFHFTGNKDGLDVSSLLSTEEYKEWSVVQPALAWWTKGFGDVTSNFGGSFFDYGIIGDGYYVRTFNLPENFDAQDLILSIGYLDDRGETFINGQLVGATGMENGVGTGESAWAIYSTYEIDPEVLNVGGTNTIVVRCQNDGMGGGGWYGGPVALYSKTAFESDDSASSLFKEESFESKYAASAQGLEGTVENKYLVYLPEGYYESEKYYPTVYLMHQYNSDHTSYIIDGVDDLVDEAIKQALLDEMIVVVPNSAESSWWRGDWMKMVTEELLPLIDSKYRTIDDARYRFTAGCSMGGQGAFGVALTNPDLFSGAISFFGAFSMGGDASPNKIAANESAEYLEYFSMYFICGNQDVYKFGQPAIELHQQLLEMNVDHEFFIDNGEHDSEFYLPHLIEAFVYTRNNMYKSDDAVESLLTGTATVSNKGILKAEFEALAGIEEYYNLIPDSSYTEDGTPDLSIPLKIEIVQNGEVVYSVTERNHAINTGDVTETFKYDISKYVNLDAEYTITFKAAIFDRVVELGKYVMNETTDDGNDAGNGTTKPSDTTKPSITTKPSTNKTSSVKTGDSTPIVLYTVVALMALAAISAVVIIRKKKA